MVGHAVPSAPGRECNDDAIIGQAIDARAMGTPRLAQAGNDLTASANSLLDRIHPSLAQFPMKPTHDVFHQRRTFVNQSRVNLNQRRARRDLFPRILATENSPDADNGQSTARLIMNVPNHLRAACAQRTPAETAGFGVNATQSIVERIRPGDGRVGRNDSGKLALQCKFKNLIQCIERKIRRDFDEQWFRVSGFGFRVGSRLAP